MRELKAELEKKEAELLKSIRRKTEKLDDRVNRLGVNTPSNAYRSEPSIPSDAPLNVVRPAPELVPDRVEPVAVEDVSERAPKKEQLDKLQKKIPGIFNQWLAKQGSEGKAKTELKLVRWTGPTEAKITYSINGGRGRYNPNFLPPLL